MRFRRFAWSVLGVNLLVILWGALVRASGSGAGCGRHWPLCNGSVLPLAPAQATLIEFVHRATSGLALVLVAALWWWSRNAFPRGSSVRRAAAASLGFIVLEALIGAGLVLLELVGQNASLARAGYLALHLLNTFLLLAALALTAHWGGAGGGGAGGAGGSGSWQPDLRGTAPRLLAGGLLLLLVVGMSGAVTALGDTLFPATSLAEGLRADWEPGAHFLVRLRVLHPVLAVLTGAYLCGMVALVQRARPEAPARRWGAAICLLVLAQLGVGVTNLLLLAPLPLQLAHLFLADLLWIATVVFGAAALAGEAHILATIASANSLVRSSVAPSMRRWKS